MAHSISHRIPNQRKSFSKILWGLVFVCWFSWTPELELWYLELMQLNKQNQTNNNSAWMIPSASIPILVSSQTINLLSVRAARSIAWQALTGAEWSPQNPVPKTPTMTIGLYGPLETPIQWKASQNITYREEIEILIWGIRRLTSDKHIFNQLSLEWVPQSNIMAKYYQTATRFGKREKKVPDRENILTWFTCGSAAHAACSQMSQISSQLLADEGIQILHDAGSPIHFINGKYIEWLSFDSSFRFKRNTVWNERLWCEGEHHIVAQMGRHRRDTIVSCCPVSNPLPRLLLQGFVLGLLSMAWFRVSNFRYLEIFTPAIPKPGRQQFWFFSLGTSVHDPYH